MLIKSLAVGQLEANCFIVADEKTKEAMAIDPGDEPDRIIEIIKENNLRVKYIVCTHAHFDHVGAISDIKDETGARIVIHQEERELYNGARDHAAFLGYELEPLPEPDMLVNEGDKLEIGDLKFEILHTPGHSPGGICLYGENVVFTGDTLFAGSVGRTDFYGGDMNKLKKSFSRLMSLPPDTKVFAGHGPSSTIKHEKASNFFMEEI
ncbi:MAG: MBL fold metallo-hydrolase [Nitrospirae bacterium]|nr:MAG: MBL fold metallo-hydrolase [Nitrospirota bacterium]